MRRVFIKNKLIQISRIILNPGIEVPIPGFNPGGKCTGIPGLQTLSTIDISESLNGVIGDALPMSIPPWTPSNNSFPLIDLSLASSSVSSASGDPPPVLRADNTLSLIMGLCLAYTLDHFLETSSLLLKVPCDCEISLAISSQTLFFSSKVKEQLKAPKSLDLFYKTKSTSEDISSDEKFFERVFIDISNSKGD